MPSPHLPTHPAGFSFGYNVGYGVIGGITPIVVTSMIEGLPKDIKALAPAIWLVSLGALSLVGCWDASCCAAMRPASTSPLLATSSDRA